MAIWNSLKSLWRNLFDQAELERDLDEELKSYVQLLTDEKIAAGMDPAAAARSARIEAGAIEHLKEEVRDVRAGRLLHEVWSDGAFALRTMAKRPGWALLIVLTLGLGLAVNTAIFGVFNAVLLQPLPYEQPQQLVHVFETSKQQDFSRREASYGDFLDLSQSGLFDDVAGYNGGSVTLTNVEQPDRVQILQVTDNFFDLLGVKPAAGRAFLRGESGPSSQTARVLMLTHGSWQRRFGGDEELVGTTLQLNGAPYTVVGILPRGFEFPLRGDAEFVLPLSVSDQQQERRYWHWLDVIARLRDGQSALQAQNELSNLARHFGVVDPQGHNDIGLIVVALRDEIVGSVRPMLAVLMGAVGLVLLIVCANVAGLMVCQSISRRKEMGIRAALGAGRGRLVRQLLTETVLLGLFSGLVGLLLAPHLMGLLTSAIPERQLSRLPHLGSLTLDLPAFLFGLGLAICIGAILGLASSWKTLRLDSAEVLNGTRSTTGRQSSRLNQTLVIAEVAVAVVLLVGAGLLTKSLVRLLETSPGFDTGGLLTMRISAPGSEYRGEKLTQFHRELEERLEAIGEVRSVAAVSQLPLTGRGDTGAFRIVGEDPDNRPEVNIRFVSPNYFATLGLPVLEGVGFGPTDILSRPGVVLVNRLAARRIFEDDPIGRRIVFQFFDGQPEWKIVGIVADEKVDHLAGGNTPVVYFSMQQVPFNTFSLVARVRDGQASVEQAIRQVVQGIDAQIPVFGVLTMEEIVSTSAPIFVRRYLMSLIASFAAISLFLAALGVYGILAYFVSSRTREIAIRMTFGADRGQILKLILGRGLRLAALGAGAGVMGALLLTRTLTTMLFEVSPTDPASVASAVLVLTAAVAIACGLPALRASRIEPTQSLRFE